MQFEETAKRRRGQILSFMGVRHPDEADGMRAMKADGQNRKHDDVVYDLSLLARL